MNANSLFNQFYIKVCFDCSRNTSERKRMGEILSRYGYSRNAHVLEGHFRQWLEAEDPSVLEHLEILPDFRCVCFRFTEEAYYHRFRRVVDVILSDERLLEEYTQRADPNRIDKQGHGQKVMVKSTTLSRYNSADDKLIPMAQGEVYTLKKYIQTSSSKMYFLQECPNFLADSGNFMQEKDIQHSRTYWEMVYRADVEAYRSYCRMDANEPFAFTEEQQKEAVYWLALLENFQRQINLAGIGNTDSK
jgi:hypothetical protein